MLEAIIEIREGTFTRRVRVEALTLERALQLVGPARVGRSFRVLSPTDLTASPTGGEEKLDSKEVA